MKQIFFRSFFIYSLTLIIGILVLFGFSIANAAEKGVFEFSAWAGPPLIIHYYEAEGLDASAPIVIVMHGMKRNADTYLQNWIKLARYYGLAVYVPEFDSERFPGSRYYNLGAQGLGKVSAFDAIEPLFDTIKKRRQTTQDHYVIFGHSAGAQFVHRYAILRPQARFRMAIAANAGWYTMPDFQIDWPYGLGRAGNVDIRAAFAKPLIIMLGENDNNPDAKNLRKSPQAEAQGSHRYDRGKSFIRTASQLAKNRNTSLSWQLITVEDVGHSNSKMAKAAAELISKSFSSASRR